MLAPDSPETSCPHSVTSLCKSRVFFPYTGKNWAWGFTIWCTRSPQSIRSATGFRLKNLKLLSPTMKGTALCGTSRQTATGMSLIFCQENGTALSAWHGLQAFQVASRTRVGGTGLAEGLLSSFLWAWIRQCYRCWLSNVSWVLNIISLPPLFYSFLDRFQPVTVNNSFSCCLSFFLLLQ